MWAWPKRFAWLGLVAGTLGACTSSVQPRPTAEIPPRLHDRPLTDLVPAAGLRWLVVAEPKALYAQPTVKTSLARLFPEERLDAFAQASGIDLLTLETGVIAGFDLGTLYLAKTTDRIGIAQQAFADRLVSPPVTKHLGTAVTQTTGVIGLTPESFVAMDGIGIALSVGDPTLAKISGAYALGKLTRSPSALRGAALRELPASLETFPLRFYAPGPFTGSWARGAEGLLADCVAVAIVARPEPDGGLLVVVTALGDYGEATAENNRKVRQLITEVASSTVGRLLGLSALETAPEIVVEPRRIDITVRLPLARLTEGLYTAVAANVWEMMELLPPQGNSGSNPRP